MRRGAKPGKAKVVAKRPRPRTSPKDEASKRHDLEKRLAESLEREKSKDRALTEALEQQTATSEILRVIAGSGATDVTACVRRDPSERPRALRFAVRCRPAARRRRSTPPRGLQRAVSLCRDHAGRLSPPIDAGPDQRACDSGAQGGSRRWDCARASSFHTGELLQTPPVSTPRSSSRCSKRAAQSARSAWGKPTRSVMIRLPCSRLLPTKPSSRSRTCGCSRSWRRVTAI